jgi:hypothetical protein
MTVNSFFIFGSYPKKLVILVASTASNETGVFRFEATGTDIAGFENPLWGSKRAGAKSDTNNMPTATRA